MFTIVKMLGLIYFLGDFIYYYCCKVLKFLSFGYLKHCTDFDIDIFVDFIFKYFPRFKIYILENIENVSYRRLSLIFGFTDNQVYGIELYKYIIKEYKNELSNY